MQIDRNPHLVRQRLSHKLAGGELQYIQLPLKKNVNGVEDLTKNVPVLHEWHKLIANNNEIRDFAILKLLFELKTEMKVLKTEMKVFKTEMKGLNTTMNS